MGRQRYSEGPNRPLGAFKKEDGKYEPRNEGGL